MAGSNFTNWAISLTLGSFSAIVTNYLKSCGLRMRHYSHAVPEVRNPGYIRVSARLVSSGRAQRRTFAFPPVVADIPLSDDLSLHALPLLSHFPLILYSSFPFFAFFCGYVCMYVFVCAYYVLCMRRQRTALVLSCLPWFSGHGLLLAGTSWLG